MEKWIGRNAVVTGASAGIGAAIAEKLVRAGLQVIGLAPDKERIDEASKALEGEKGKLIGLKVDITKENEVVEAFKWIEENLGPVHILINNAGILRKDSLMDGNSRTWRQMFDTNVLGLCVATREALRTMKANSIDGHIIHINSIGGHKVITIPNHNVYSGTKFAITALAETLRHELNNNKLKIKITSLSPGYVKTELVNSSGFEMDELPLKNAPALQPEDVADGILYVLGTPPHVLVNARCNGRCSQLRIHFLQVQELTITPVGDPF